MQTNYTGETVTTHTTFNTTQSTMPETAQSGSTDHLRHTRQAIRRQLRFLFIYPLIYLLMWSFPFASHALNYDDRYVNRPIFWLSIVQTCSLALQAGVDSVVFSLREKPWRRIDDSSRLSIPHFKGRVVGSMYGVKRRSRSQPTQASRMPSTNQMKRNSSHWWEAEGRKRKDSVWMGTDMLTRMATNREQRQSPDGPDRRDNASERSSTRSRR